MKTIVQNWQFDDMNGLTEIIESANATMRLTAGGDNVVYVGTDNEEPTQFSKAALVQTVLTDGSLVFDFAAIVMRKRREMTLGEKKVNEAFKEFDRQQQAVKRTWEIADLDGSNKRTVTLAQYRAELDAAKAKARADYAAACKTMGTSPLVVGREV